MSFAFKSNTIRVKQADENKKSNTIAIFCVLNKNMSHNHLGLKREKLRIVLVEKVEKVAEMKRKGRREKERGKSMK